MTKEDELSAKVETILELTNPAKILDEEFDWDRECWMEALTEVYKQGWNDALDGGLCEGCKGNGEIRTPNGVMTCYDCRGSGTKRAKAIRRLRKPGKEEG